MSYYSSKNQNNLFNLTVNSLTINQVTFNTPLNANYTLVFPPTAGANGQYLTTDGTGVLSWGGSGGPIGTVTSVGIIAPSFLTVAGSPITSSGSITLSLSGVPVPYTSGGTGTASIGSPGQFVVVNSGATGYSFTNLSSIGTVTNFSASAPTGFNATVTNPGTTPNLSLTYSGAAIPVVNGGTGTTSSSGSNSVVLRDSNSNITVNNSFLSSLSVTAAAGTTTLTVSSPYFIEVTGSNTQNIKLPDATTIPTLGVVYIINNDTTTSAIVVKNNASTTLYSIPQGGCTSIILKDNSTTNGVWDFHSNIPAQAQWGASGLITSTYLQTSSTFNIQNGSNVISIDGSGSSGSYTFKLPATAGTSGQVLTSQGGSTMTWQTLTGGGTVSSITLTVPSFLSVSPSTITTSGTFAITAPSSTGTGGVVLSKNPTITSTSGGTESLILTNSDTISYVTPLSLYGTGMSAGSTIYVTQGQSSSNACGWQYYYAGNASAGNSTAITVGSNYFRMYNSTSTAAVLNSPLNLPSILANGSWGTAGYYLTSGGTGGTISWAAPSSGSGSVTSVNVNSLGANPTTNFITFSGGPITTSGAISASFTSTPTLPNSVITSTVNYNAALQITNTSSAASFMLTKTEFAPNTNTGNVVASQFGVNNTGGNYSQTNFSYSGSGSSSNAVQTFIGSNYFTMYNSNSTPTTLSSPLTVSGALVSSTSLSVSVNASGVYTPLSLLNANTTSGNIQSVLLGTAASAGNSAQWNYYYSGSNSTSNYTQLGFYGAGGQYLTLYNNSSSTSTNWNGTFTATGSVNSTSGFTASNGSVSALGIGGVFFGNSLSNGNSISQSFNYVGSNSTSNSATYQFFGATGQSLTLYNNPSSIGTSFVGNWNVYGSVISIPDYYSASVTSSGASTTTYTPIIGWSNTSSSGRQLAYSGGNWTNTLGYTVSVTVSYRMNRDSNAFGSDSYQISKNGSYNPAVSYAVQVGAALNNISGSSVLLLNNGDYFTIYWYQTSGSTLSASGTMNYLIN